MERAFLEFFIVKWNYDHMTISIQKYPVASFLVVKVKVIAFDKDLFQCKGFYYKPRHRLSL